jgi:hypothetical protein
MSKTSNTSDKNGRIVIRGVRRKRPDTSKIARAIISLALHEAALEAEAAATSPATTTPRQRGGSGV